MIGLLNGTDYILWGAGRFGRRFYELYARQKRQLPKPLYWCDSDISQQGKQIDGIEVISPRNAFEIKRVLEKKGGNIAIIIGINGHGALQVAAQLAQMGIEHDCHMAEQLEAEYYFARHEEECREVLSLLEDEPSRVRYKAQIENMRLGRPIDFSLAEKNAYWGNDVVPALMDGEVLLDAGVCEGEEIDRAFALNENLCIHAFEPDRDSFLALREKYADENRVILHEQALWRETCEISFRKTSNPAASAISTEQGTVNTIVHAVSLDGLAGIHPTFIKMDIEGAEYDALHGASETLARYRPKLAVCLYHNVADYLRIPLLIKSIAPCYKFYFRKYSFLTSFESVLYAM